LSNSKLFSSFPSLKNQKSCSSIFNFGTNSGFIDFNNNQDPLTPSFLSTIQDVSQNKSFP